MKSVIGIAVIALVCLTSFVGGQRGCPSEGCDPRGLNCQADFTVNGTSISEIWRINLGSNVSIDEQKSLGCVGNDKNVLCQIGDEHSQGYVSLNGNTGDVNWYDTLLHHPRLPIMDLGGDMIATDGHYLEMRLKNGSLAGKPASFYGFINDTSSIHYVMDPSIFFFVSYTSGGMYMYDTSGMCVASYFLDNNVPTGPVWVPITRLIVNNELDPPCTYFIAQNNATRKYRLYAVNFNHQPPYLQVKWFIDLPEIDSVSPSDLANVRMVSRGNTLLVGFSVAFKQTLIINDTGTSGEVQGNLTLYTNSFASYDYPAGSLKPTSVDQPLIWLNTIDEAGQAVIYSWTNTGRNGTLKHSIHLSQIFNAKLAALTSEVMVFGYHPDDITLVFAFTVIYSSGDERETETGGYLIAVKPLPDGSVRPLWSHYLGQTRFVIGQIIGHQEKMLLATALDASTDEAEVIGLELV